MTAINPFFAQLQTSGIRVIGEMARKIEGAIELQIGEPSFHTPDHIVRATQDALLGRIGYTATGGRMDLRQAVSEHLKRRHDFDVSAREITMTPGGVTAVWLAVTLAGGHGRSVLIPDPGWPNYVGQSLVAGAQPVFYPLRAENDFLPDVHELESLARSSRAAAIIINTPSNPTGVVYPRATLQALAALARKLDIFLISDEVYDEIVFEGRHESLWHHAPERTMVIFSFSKSYAMTGYRLGYLVAPEALSVEGDKLLEATVSCASEVAQQAGLAALTGPQEVVATMRQTYRENRDAAVHICRTAGLRFAPPGGAFYLWLDVGSDANRFAVDLLRQRHVAVTPGDAFGPTGTTYVRISLAPARDLLEEGLLRLVAHRAERASLTAD